MGGMDITLEDGVATSPIVPPWTLGKDKKKFMEWFNTTLPILEKLSEYRVITQANNLLWYTGEYDKTLEYRWVVPGQASANVPQNILPRIFSHLTDITERRVANLSRYKPSFECVPTNNEEIDRTNARLYKLALDAAVRRVHFDFMLQEVERWNAVFGECLIGVEWDPDIGDRAGYRTIDRIGDVKIYLKEPWTYLPEPKRRYEQVTWCIDIYDIMPVEEVRERWGKKDLKPDGKTNIFSFNDGVQEKREDELVVYRVIQKPTRFCPKGQVDFIAGGEHLERLEEYPWSHFDFPWERHTDIDVPGRLFPMSYYQHLKPIQHVYNKLTSIIVRNMTLVGHPKIMAPAASGIKIEDFTNKPTLVKFNGTQEPRVLTFSSVPNEMFSFRKEVKDEMGQVAGVQGVSRGTPPPGARAASMLRFYEEQEEQRASTQIIKHNDLIRRTLLKAASVIGEYYPTNGKERLIRVVGRENQYAIEKFSASKMSSEYDVIIVNSTGFSESMAGRLEEIGLMQQYCPGVLTPQQIMDVLEMKNPQKAYDIVTAAIKQAEDENNRFLDGKPVPAPRNYQDLILHWKTHMILLNSSSFEESTPEDVKQAALRHLATTERLMVEKMKESAAYAQILETLPGFPCLYHPDEPDVEEKPDSGAPKQGGGQPPPRPERPMEINPQMMNGGAVDDMATSPELEAPPLIPPNPVAVPSVLP